jgi:FkbM family methyltransferase
MKIFLDIGAHHGETLSIVSQLKYNFDRIYCFEPIKKNRKKLNKVRGNNEKIILNDFGFLSESCKKVVYNPGSSGASVLKEKVIKKPTNKTEICEFVRVSDWFKNNLNKEDDILGKINIEGTEIEVLNDLLDSGEYSKFRKVIISFDVIKIPGKEYLKEQMLERFSKEGIENFSILRNLRDEFKEFPEEIMMNKVYDKWIGVDNGLV